MKTGTAADVMNRDVLMVREDMTLSELAAFLTEHEITGAPVVDRKGKPVGVVSVTDMAESYSAPEDSPRQDRHHQYFAHGWEGRVNADELRGIHVEGEGRLVADIMTPTVFTVPEETPVSQIAKTMIAGRIHRLLVTRKERIVGIVTTLDLLRLLCQED